MEENTEINEKIGEEWVSETHSCDMEDIVEGDQIEVRDTPEGERTVASSVVPEAKTDADHEEMNCDPPKRLSENVENEPPEEMISTEESTENSEPVSCSDNLKLVSDNLSISKDNT